MRIATWGYGTTDRRVGTWGYGTTATVPPYTVALSVALRGAAALTMATKGGAAVTVAQRGSVTLTTDGG